MKWIGVFIAFTLVGCSAKKQPDADVVRLQQEWFANANYAGALMAREHFAPQQGLKITLIPGSDTVDALKLLLAGSIDVADVGADRVAEAVGKGAPLTVIGVVSYQTPTIFLVPAALNVTHPKQFEGLRVGVLHGTNTELVYRLLKSWMRLDPTKIKEVDAPFDLPSFVAGAYDVRPAYAYDEPVSLEKQKFEVTKVDPAAFGVRFIGTVYVVRSAFVKNHEQTVRKFIDAVADGWRGALRDPSEAIRLLKQLDSTIDVDRETRSFELLRTYVKGRNDKVLTADKDDWIQMLKGLSSLGTKVDNNIDGWVDTRFTDEYHEKVR